MSFSKNALTLLFFCFFTFSIAAQDALTVGWQHFANNDFDAARSVFETALNGPDKARAHLALHLVGAAESAESAATFQHFKKFYETSDNPTPYIMGLWSTNYGQRTDAEIDFLEELIEKEQGTLKALALQALGNHHYASNDSRKAVRYYEQTGSIEPWSVLGEFENISESGFDKNFQALAHPDNGFNFRNKWGVPVSWFDIKAPRWDNWVDMDYFFYAQNSIIYAQNFCTSPIEQDIQFRIGVSGSVKVWVNDQLLFSESQERNNNVDAYIFPVRLSAGSNRILIQLGESETDNCNFFLRITDEKGENIEGLTFTTKVQQYDKEYNYEATVLTDEVETFFREKIAASPNNLENYLVLGQYFIITDKIFKAKSVISEARELFPHCTYLLFQQLNAYAKDDNRTETATLIEEVKQKDPDGALALGYLLDDAKNRDDLEAQEEIIQKMEDREGLSENVYQRRISLAGDKDEREVMFALIDKAYDTYPDNFIFVYFKYLVQKDVEGNARNAVRVLKKYLANHYSEEATAELASAYFNIGTVDQGVDTYQKLIENNPIATGYYSRLASLYYNLGNYKKAESYVQECISIAPYIDSYHQTLANTYSELGLQEAAETSYRKAIFYNPYNYDARRQLRILNEQPDIFSSFTEPDVYQIYADAPEGTDYPNDHSLLLADETQKVIYADGGSEEKHILVVKVFNTNGVDTWKDYQIPVYNNQDGSIDKAEVLKKNGARIAAETNGGYIVFSNLEEGDAIHITYRLQNYFSGKLANHFWGSHFFELFLPVAHTSLSLLVEEGTNFSYKVENGELEPKIEQFDNYERYTWEASNVPAIEYEALMPNLTDVGKTLHYSSFPDWNYIANWYADLAQAKAKVDFEVENVAAELFETNNTLTPREKVETIYDYIVNNIRYRSVSFLQSGLIPQKASTTIAAKQGDCKDVSTLFVALCETQGIDANLVLVNTRQNGQKEMMLPSIDFNHCIVHLPLEEKDYYLELTAENLPFAVKASSTSGAFALKIPRQLEEKVTAQVLAPTDQVPATAVRTATVSFEGDKMVISKESTKTGYAASSMRDSYEKIGEDIQRKKMQEAINGEAPGVSLKELTFQTGLDDNSAQLMYSFTYEIPSVFTDIGGLRIFSIPFSDDLSNPNFMSLTERIYPLELWQYFNWELEDETLNISIPEGYELAEIPADLKIENDNLFYELTFQVTGQALTIKRLFKLVNDSVAQENYQTLRTAIEKIVKADAQKIAFKKTEN
ncbi:DUF3857 domain-containing protein [Lewinella cohaerens]|uniref:DUF3857 domain-containing protein n=1 Tax=Lewinella cohaerens TaxID=70995 RepID=UPI0003719551|nr:DUF3857 domain-containing protein [Lewinella cohaerens]